MIEITVLVFLILLLIKPLAKERGESLLKWSLLAIVAWVGAEILVGAGVGFILWWRGIRLQSLAGVILIVILLYTTAITAALLVIHALRKKPVVANPVAATEQLT